MTGSSRPDGAGAAADERLAAALRENLRRRKRQQVLRAAPAEEAAPLPSLAPTTAGPEGDVEPRAPADTRRP